MLRQAQHACAVRGIWQMPTQQDTTRVGIVCEPPPEAYPATTEIYRGDLALPPNEEPTEFLETALNILVHVQETIKVSQDIINIHSVWGRELPNEYKVITLD